MNASFNVKLTGNCENNVILLSLHDVKYVNNLFQAQFQRKPFF